MTSNNPAVVDNSLAERRRYKREQVDLAGRQFEPSESREAECKIVDLSPGGAHVLSNVVPPCGALVVIYIEGFGRIEGNIARTEQNGFGIQFNCSAHKRERFAELLKRYMSGSPLDETTLRRHDRRSAKGNVSFTRANGNEVNCKMLDISLSGVAVATEIRPPIGELVSIGGMAGRVARHHDTGIGIEFVSPDKAVA
jgi:hypothetical protein